ncbi:MAG: DUF4365 domain-containing protein, partial [Desulfobacula sp.]
MTSILQEDKGLIKIHSICVEMNAIWRPTPNHDLGIDGQIEFLENSSNISTGHIIAVQSKSGPSYFKNQDDEYVRYHAEERHVRYWKRIKIPTILVLHNPETDETLYTRVKPQLKNNETVIFLSKTCYFTGSERDKIIYETQQDYEQFINKTPFEIIESFKRIEHKREGHKLITGVEFILASTNILHNYFELRMCRINSLYSLLSENSGFSLNTDDYEFIQRNVLQFHAQRMIPDFLEEFDEAWFKFHIVPDISVPLTETGTKAIRYLWDNLDGYINISHYSHLDFKDPQKIAKCITDDAQMS